VVFSSYTDETTKKICLLEISKPFDTRCSTFFTTTPLGSMVKLAFLPYGYDVHKALHAQGLAPTLYGRSHKPVIGADIVVMEYLPPPTPHGPGWRTLHYFHDKHPALVREKKDAIWVQLNAIVSTLKGLGFVHGDLRPNNLMIHVTQDTIVDPVTVKAVDMEWAGKVGVACYPEDRNDIVGYPGEAAGLIGPDDDTYMVGQLWNEFFT